MPGMLTQRNFYKKPSFWRWGISLALFLVTLIVTWRGFSFLFNNLTGEVTTLFINLQQARLLLIFLYLVGFVFFLFFSLLFISQFLLPVNGLLNRWKIFERLCMYLVGFNGATIFVKEGKKIARLEELISDRPGLAIVDLTSAIVLEKQYLTGTRTLVGAAGARFVRLASKPSQIARAAGPGIVFTDQGERIRGTVSLRRQFRGEANVRSITRDGFEVSSFVFSLFSLGEPPEVLKVTLTGDTADSIRVIEVDTEKQVVKRLSDELDDDDKQEIYRFILKNWRREQPAQREKPKEPFKFKPPYSFDAERVFNAVYGNARLVKEGFVEEWSELPIKVAIETYHDLVPQENYDSLYLPSDPVKFPFREEFRPRFGQQVRNQGVLAYQVFFNADRQPIKEGQTWIESKLVCHPEKNLEASKVLRDRGIRVIAAGFAELRPTNPAILQQRLDHWRASWQRRSEETQAGYYLQEMQIRAHARANVQKIIVEKLVDVLNDKDLSDEAIAINLIQSLDAFSKIPETEKLLPKESLVGLAELSKWLKP